MPSAGFLIYSGVMPLLKTYITITTGYALAKMDLFPPAASRGASEVAVNIAIPALLFANVVPAFTPSNISSLGPLFLTALVYQAFGFLSGYLIREFCYVPRDFWQGIIILTGMSSWGNLPNAIVLSVTQQSPFNPSTDSALGVSYVSIFVVCYNIVFWTLGAAHSLSWDYRPGVPQGEEAEVRVAWKEKPLGSLITRHIFHHPTPNPLAAVETSATNGDFEMSMPDKPEEKGPSAEDATQSDLSLGQEFCSSNPDTGGHLARTATRLSAIAASVQDQRPSLSASTTPPATAPVPSPSPAQSTHNFDAQSIAQRSDTLHAPMLRQKILRMFRLLRALMTSATVTLAVSLPIALVKPLKALFVDISATGGPSFKGPNGLPPLAFLIDTANFLGGIAVPLALILLGASFARIKIPRPLSRLPMMAIFLTTMAKMVVLPVIGVLLVQRMTKSGLVHKDERALRFVMMFLSGTPTAITQLIVASLYSPDGNVDTLSAFLLIQYVFMFFSSAALTSVALLLL